MAPPSSSEGFFIQYDTVRNISSEEENTGSNPIPTEEERYTMALLALVIGMAGLVINAYMFKAYLSRSEIGFYKLCMSKTVSNWLMCASFVFYLVPFMLNGGQFLPFYIRMIPEQIVGYVGYLMGPLVQLYLAFNRCFAIFTPILYKQHSLPIMLLIATSWLFTIIITVVLVQNDCGFGFEEKFYSWGLVDENCSPLHSSLFFLLIIISSASSNLLNIPCGIKFFMLSKNQGVSLNTSKNQKLLAKKLMMQCIIQDWLPVIDVLNVLYAQGLFFSFSWTFLCTSISMLSIHVIDGFVMLCFYKKKDATTSNSKGATVRSKMTA